MTQWVSGVVNAERQQLYLSASQSQLITLIINHTCHSCGKNEELCISIEGGWRPAFIPHQLSHLRSSGGLLSWGPHGYSK